MTGVEGVLLRFLPYLLWLSHELVGCNASLFLPLPSWLEVGG